MTQESVKEHLHDGESLALVTEADIDEGIGTIVSRGTRDALEELDDGGFLMQDVHGNRYRMPPRRELDRHSRRMLERVF